MKPYAIALSWLGVQTPAAGEDVVLEVPFEVDEGAHNAFFYHTTAANTTCT